MSLPGPATVILMLVGSFVSAAGTSEDSQAASVAMRYLGSIDKSASFLLGKNQGEDVVFVGHSITQGWRVVIVHRDAKLRAIWDSASLKDPYFTVTALNSIEIRADQNEGYIVTIRGCVPHQCADGKIGFAVYASKTRQTYIAHIVTNEDGSYRVSYKPRGGLPAAYRVELDRMMCTDNGISRRTILPISCQSVTEP